MYFYTFVVSVPPKYVCLVGKLRGGCVWLQSWPTVCELVQRTNHWVVYISMHVDNVCFVLTSFPYTYIYLYIHVYTYSIRYMLCMSVV